jgi:hypothetical protein
MPNWRDMEVGAPEIGRLGAARLNAARVAMPGTLRRDRSPRSSPTEPCLVHGRLLVGAMIWSTAQISANRSCKAKLICIGATGKVEETPAAVRPIGSARSSIRLRGYGPRSRS